MNVASLAFTAAISYVRELPGAVFFGDIDAESLEYAARLQQIRTAYEFDDCQEMLAARCNAATAASPPAPLPASLRASATTGLASTSMIQEIATDRASILLPMRNAQTPSTSVMVIAVAPDAARYTMAAFVSGDLFAGRATVSTSATSSSIVIVHPAREMAELHTRDARRRRVKRVSTGRELKLGHQLLHKAPTLRQADALVCVIVCFAFCSFPASAVEVEHITEPGFSAGFVSVKITNRSDEKDRLFKRNNFLNAASGINFRPNFDSTFQAIDGFYDRPLNFCIWDTFAGHGCGPNLNVDGAATSLVDTQKNSSESIHFIGNLWVGAVWEAFYIDSVNDDLGAMGRDKFFAGEVELLLGGSPQIVGGAFQRECVPGDKGSCDGSYKRADDIQMHSDFAERERNYVVTGAVFCGLLSAFLACFAYLIVRGRI
jgi:hypothetical protein